MSPEFKKLAAVQIDEFKDAVQVWLFPQVLAIVRRWLAECVICYDDTFPQLLLFTQKASEINLVPCDSNWETKFAQTLESMAEVKAYVKNQNLGFKIPCTFEGWPRNYYPDYLLRIDDGRGMADLLNLIVEISGQELKEKEAKVETTRTMWVPAVNAEGMYGRWAFMEIDNPWNAKNTIRTFLKRIVAGGEPAA